nr:ATP synthase F0 subunit 8 [Typhlocyba bilaminata]
MPQMAPMWWTMLMLMFISAMMISMTMNYFTYNTHFMSKNKTDTMNYNWMW